MTPPTIIQFNASNVPVSQLTISSETLPEQQIFDYGLNFIRVKLFTIPGLSTPAPFGGKQRQINVDIDPRQLASKGLSPFDVVNALNSENVILPAGTARIGSREYNVLMNSSPAEVAEFANIPVKIVDGAPVLLGDVARDLRRLRRPDQHRARQRTPRHLPGHPQARRRLHPGGGRRRPRRPARRSRRRRRTASI